MNKATRGGVKRRAITPSDRNLRSGPTREGTESPANMADSLFPKNTLMGLPNETKYHIAGHMAEHDLWALSRVNRLLFSIASQVLRSKLYENAQRCKEVLLWAVEVGRHDLVRDLLAREVNPNFYYLSPILRSRLLDVLASQGRCGTPKPHKDRALLAEVFRETFCRSARERKGVISEREAARRRVPLEQDTARNLKWHRRESVSPLDIFGVVEDPQDPKTRNHWAWTPLHVAVQRGDTTSTRLLLDHGADLEARCSGLCDCAAPQLTGQDDLNESVTPHRSRSVWTALHVAMCSRDEEVAKILISRGALLGVGGRIRQPGSAHQKTRLTISGWQSAAWLGSVPMLKLLLAEPRFKPYLYNGSGRSQSPLGFAALGGHIQTVGELFLSNRAQISYGRYPGSGPPLGLINDVLRLLCMQARYDDASWLAEFCRPLTLFAPGDPVHLYTRSLAALCALRRPTVYSSLSLREQQDRLYRLTSYDLNPAVQERITSEGIEASLATRLSLAKKLLDLGADPNRAEYTYQDLMPRIWPTPLRIAYHHTPLQLAAKFGFTGMVKLLASRGANCDKIGSESKTPSDLPLLLAVEQALDSGGDRETVQALFKAGASLLDPLFPGKSILHRLYDFRPKTTPYNTQSEDRTDWQNWFRIVEMFLDHGAATHPNDPLAWEQVLEQACSPGNLPYCEMLEKARPLDGLRPQALKRMLSNAIIGCWESPTENGLIQDTEMIRWVFRRCLNRQGKLRFSRSVLSSLLQDAHRHKIYRVADLIREFQAQLEKAEK